MKRIARAIPTPSDRLPPAADCPAAHAAQHWLHASSAHLRLQHLHHVSVAVAALRHGDCIQRLRQLGWAHAAQFDFFSGHGSAIEKAHRPEGQRANSGGRSAPVARWETRGRAHSGHALGFGGRIGCCGARTKPPLAVKQENIRVLKLHAGRDTANAPVLYALSAARL